MRRSLLWCSAFCYQSLIGGAVAGGAVVQSATPQRFITDQRGIYHNGAGGTAATPSMDGGLWDSLPNAVVVHGRRGANSNINGVYARDYGWRDFLGPCYKRSGAVGRQQNIFLYFEGEWRMGPSPDEGSVWAFAASDAASPLLIKSTWEVWDGQHVVRDYELKVSDTSVIPSVLFLSFRADAPPEIVALQGMLLQQPGLWEGRPYYKHQVWHDFFLLCSMTEGRWRLGPLPISSNPSGIDNAVLYTASASSLPQEIIEPWNMQRNESAHVSLADGVVKLSTTASRDAESSPRVQYPRHLVIEGMSAGDGVPNGVYRRAQDDLNLRPVYHKTDALRPASLWFSGEWRLGKSISEGMTWTFASSAAVSPLAINVPWHRLDTGLVERDARLVDANEVIVGTVYVAGQSYLWTQTLCDARPVYQREAPHGDNVVFLYFRAQLSEWWLGPTVGGSVCYARAGGSRLRVVQDMDHLVWQLATDVWHASGGEDAARNPNHRNMPTLATSDVPTGENTFQDERHLLSEVAETKGLCSWWCTCAFLLLMLVCSARLLGYPAQDFMSFFMVDNCESPGSAAVSAFPLRALGLRQHAVEAEASFNLPKASKSRSPKASSLSCVVCLEAPRNILLLPCRHVCCCNSCADRLEKCPMCRALKKGFSKVFL